MSEIKTYPKMNHHIKKMLGFSSNLVDQYALARIVELEKENQSLEKQVEIYCDI